MGEDRHRWQWVEKARRYRDLATGRFISAEQARHWADLSIDASANRARELAGLLRDGKLNLPDWQAEFRERIKREYVKQYLEGLGGEKKLSIKDRASLGGMLKEQYKYLDRFAREIAAGNLSYEQIARRMEMYINSAREARSRAEERAAKAGGFSEVRWMRDTTPPIPESCQDCVALEAMGWQEMEPWPFKLEGQDAHPGDGKSECLTMCRCHLEFRKVKK